MAMRSSLRWLRIIERTVPVFLPVVTAVVGGLWGLSIFVAGQRDAAARNNQQIADTAQTRLIEAQKPFLDKQLELYVRTSKTVGTLVTSAPSSPEWIPAYREFQSLFWAELPMVESTAVETAMVNMRTALMRYQFNNSLVTEVQKRSYCLGHAIRQSIQDSWKVRVGTGEIPTRIFEGTVLPSPEGSAPPSVNVDADCKSEVRHK